MKRMPETLPQMVHQALRDWITGELDYDAWREMLVVAETLDGQPFPEFTLAVKETLLKQLGSLEMQSGELGARILRLRFLDGLTAREAANSLHLSENIVYKQQRQAIDGLAAALWQAEEAAREEKAARIAARLESADLPMLFGAEAKLEELARVLGAPDAPWLVAVTGIGGIGKTSLADAVVRRLAKLPDFVDIAWVSARQDRYTFWDGLEENAAGRPALSMEGLVEAVSRQLGFQELARLSAAQKQAGLRERLKARPYLMVIDNLETAADYRALVPGLPALTNPTKFLLTSRHALHDFPGIFGISLEELSASDSLALLRHEAALRGLADVASAPDETLLPVHEAAGGNPLALKLLVGQMHMLSVPRIVADLREAQGKTVDELYRYIYWRAWQRMGDDERRVLTGMPLVAESGGKLEQIAALSQLPRERLTAALKHLVQLSLIDVRGTPAGRRYGIHRLTETFLLNEVLKWQVQENRRAP
jgi:predicted DNA-binding protein (UPF0251 family)